MKQLAALFLLLVSSSAMAAPEPPLSEAAMLSHIRYLADDRLEGRAPGTAGGELASAYVARQFQEAGLVPAAPDGSWYQPVAMVERVPVSWNARWQASGRSIGTSSPELLLTSRDGLARLGDLPVVFAGHGISLADGSFNNLAGIDLSGKLVLLMPGRPKGAETAPGLEERRQAIAEAGAAAVIVIAAASDPWASSRDRLMAGEILADDAQAAPVSGVMSHAAWTRLAHEAGLDPAALEAEAQAPRFRARPLDLTASLNTATKVRRFQSHNVLGRLPGKSHPDEAVLFLAHWDHLGRCAPADAPDRICNGAVDNASGVAMLIEVARRFASRGGSPRSLYFLATTGEEAGLLGARAFVRQPPIALDRIAAAFNFDTVAVAPAGAPVAVVGRGYTGLDPVIDKASRRQRRAIGDSSVANDFLRRQDGWVLLQAGVPSVMVGGALGEPAHMMRYLEGHYHGPGDDAGKPIELSGAAEDGALHIVLGRMLADPAFFRAREGDAR